MQSLGSMKGDRRGGFNYTPEPYWKPTNVDIMAKSLADQAPEDQI